MLKNYRSTTIIEGYQPKGNELSPEKPPSNTPNQGSSAMRGADGRMPASTSLCLHLHGLSKKDIDRILGTLPSRRIGRAHSR